MPAVSGSARAWCSPVSTIVASSRGVANRARSVLPTRRSNCSAAAESTKISSGRFASGGLPASSFGRSAQQSRRSTGAFSSIWLTVTGRPAAVRPQNARSAERTASTTCGSRSMREKSASSEYTLLFADPDVLRLGGGPPARDGAVRAPRPRGDCGDQPSREAGEHGQRQPGAPAQPQLGAQANPDGRHLQLPAAERERLPPGRLDAAVPHRHDPVGRLGHALVVGHEQDRLAARVQAAEELEHLQPARRVERAGRLVGKQQRRLVDERAGDRESLTLAARQRAGSVVRPLGEPQQVEQVASARLGGLALSRPR